MPTVAPLGGPVCEVVTVAKRDLKAGERLDGIGGFCTYGLIDNADGGARHDGAAHRPLGRLRVAAGCAEGRRHRFDDVDAVPQGSSRTLWREQNARWPLAKQGARRILAAAVPKLCAASSDEACLIASFWKGRRVFLTGHTGFKGSWLSLWLDALGAEVTGYALDPPTQPNLFEQAGVPASCVDRFAATFATFARLKGAMAECRPEVVIHMAAQSVVRRGYEDPIENYSSNVMGTVHLLEACGS